MVALVAFVDGDIELDSHEAIVLKTVRQVYSSVGQAYSDCTHKSTPKHPKTAS
jgi:hypothetical protein